MTMTCTGIRFISSAASQAGGPRCHTAPALQPLSAVAPHHHASAVGYIDTPLASSRSRHPAHILLYVST